MKNTGAQRNIIWSLYFGEKINKEIALKRFHTKNLKQIICILKKYIPSKITSKRVNGKRYNEYYIENIYKIVQNTRKKNIKKEIMDMSLKGFEKAYKRRNASGLVTTDFGKHLTDKELRRYVRWGIEHGYTLISELPGYEIIFKK